VLQFANPAATKDGIVLIMRPVANGLAARKGLGERDLADQRSQATVPVIEHLFFGKQRAQLSYGGIDDELEGKKRRDGYGRKAEQYKQQNPRAQAFRDLAALRSDRIVPRVGTFSRQRRIVTKSVFRLR